MEYFSSFLQVVVQGNWFWTTDPLTDGNLLNESFFITEPTYQNLVFLPAQEHGLRRLNLVQLYRLI